MWTGYSALCWNGVPVGEVELRIRTLCLKQEPKLPMMHLMADLRCQIFRQIRYFTMVASCPYSLLLPSHSRKRSSYQWMYDSSTTIFKLDSNLWRWNETDVTVSSGLIFEEFSIVKCCRLARRSKKRQAHNTRVIKLCAILCPQPI